MGEPDACGGDGLTAVDPALAWEEYELRGQQGLDDLLSMLESGCQVSIRTSRQGTPDLWPGVVIMSFGAA